MNGCGFSDGSNPSIYFFSPSPYSGKSTRVRAGVQDGMEIEGYEMKPGLEKLEKYDECLSGLPHSTFIYSILSLVGWSW